MLKILIVDYSDTLRTHLTKNLRDIAEVTTCDVNVSVLEQVYAIDPDIIMMDMMLEGQDAFEILQVIRSSGRNPEILATVDGLSEYVRARLASLQVAYTITRPYKMSVLLARLRELVKVKETEGSFFANETDEIGDLLLTLGIYVGRNGYNCLHCALTCKRENPQASIWKELYPQVVETCGGTDKSVDQAIHRLIKDAWEKRDRRVWRFFFPQAMDDKAKCPTNGKFFDAITAYLRQEKQAM